MESNFFFGISLTASFLAGVLALFAPCCITFLFPSYLGTIFSQAKINHLDNDRAKMVKQSRVMFYTLIFALGLSSILIPVALGFRLFVFFFDQFHREIYYLGGLFLIFMGVMTLKPIFNFRFSIFKNLKQPKIDKNINTISVFTLGLMSGLSSSCCAPVLFAAVTLTSLSPTIFQATVVSLAYVMGIVFPLFVLSLFYEKATEKISGKNRQKIYNIFKILGAGIFILSGILIIIFNFLGKIQMYQMEGYSRTFRLWVYQIAKYFQNPVADIAVFGVILVISYWLFRKNANKGE
ncbi:MAG: cytochrome c biogenesis CcdA family protein [Microgenomates group bacterium]